MSPAREPFSRLIVVSKILGTSPLKKLSNIFRSESIRMYSLPLLQEPADKISSECVHFHLKTNCDSEKSLLSILSWATIRETEIYARDVTIGSGANSFKKNQTWRPENFSVRRRPANLLFSSRCSLVNIHSCGQIIVCFPSFLLL